MTEFFFKTLNKKKSLIDEALKKYLGQVTKELPGFDNVFVKKQYELLVGYCLRNGKRLRPIMTLMAYQAVGGKNERKILLPALAFELFHNYTLIHDDIYDEDEKRRDELSNHILLQQWFEQKYGKRTVASKLYKNMATRFGVVAGIINGKCLHILSCLPILEAKISNEKKLAGLKLYKEVSLVDNVGQAMDLSLEEERQIKEKEYYQMVLCKTGQLFKAAIEWGAILGSATASQRKALKSYAGELGQAFQIKDDLLDIGVAGKKGREVGSDIKKGKKTLLVIYALKKANAQQKKNLLEALGNQKATSKQIKEIIKTFYELGSIRYCEKIAAQKIKKAINCLDLARPSFLSGPKNFFQELARFMFERSK